MRRRPRVDRVERAGRAGSRPASGWRTGRGSWKLRARPRRVRWCAGRPSMSPGRRSARCRRRRAACREMQLTSVVLPEPFGPIRPSRSPGCTSRSTPSSATKPPKRLLSPLTSSSERPSVIASAGSGTGRRCPAGARMTKATSSTPDDQQVDRRGDRHRGDLLQRAEQHRADHRAEPARRCRRSAAWRWRSPRRSG